MYRVLAPGPQRLWGYNSSSEGRLVYRPLSTHLQQRCRNESFFFYNEEDMLLQLTNFPAKFALTTTVQLNLLALWLAY
jgi:hypothetical protein